jgi:hypothetical protein
VLKLLRFLPLIVLVVIGFWLRFWQLDSIPAGLNWDEAAVGYNAYSLLLTGKDEFGRAWPLFIESFGDYKTALYSILITPIIKELGLSVFSVRILNVFVGSSAIIAAYYLGLVWFRQRRWALVLATLITFSPLTIHLSRFALEWYMALPLLLWGMAAILRGLENPRYLLLASSLLSFSLYWYHSLRLFLPLLLICFFVIYRRKLLAQPKYLWWAIGLGLLTILPLVRELFVSPMMARPAAVSLFGGEKQQYRYQEEMYRSTVMDWPLRRAINNKAVFFGQEVTQRYLGHFEPDFLFFGADATPRISIYPLGKLPLVALPWLLIGVGVLVRRRQPRDYLLLAWLLLAPLPASFSQDAPHGLRSLFLLPALQLTVITGLIASYQYLQQYWSRQKTYAAAGIIAILFSLETSRQLFYYFAFYREETASFWQAGQADLVAKLNVRLDDYKQVIVTTNYGQPHIFLAFFTPIPPTKYQQQISTGQPTLNSRIDRLEKIQFRNPKESDYCQENTLIIMDGPLRMKNLQPIDIVLFRHRFHEDQPIFYFYDTSDPLIYQYFCLKGDEL